MYFFILGHNPTLSIAEIYAQIRINFPQNLCELSNEALILEINKKINAEKLQNKLGGTIKIGQILMRTSAELTQINTDIFLKELLKKINLSKNQTKKKIFFGFSIYQLDPLVNVKWLMPQIKKLAMEIKTKLKEIGIPSRWVNSKEKALSSVIIQKNKLLEQGIEFCLFFKRQNNTDKDPYQLVYLGKTLSCQKFEEYELYDFGRPARKIEEGMLPPKLAKIMINLAQAPKTGTILDPFCGSGTILQEALLMGYKKIIGTDISKEAVKNSQENIKWLTEKISKSKFLISKQFLNSNVQVFQTDVREISKKLPLNSIDAIVTEPYLGPIKISNLKNQISKIILELSDLYIITFKEFKKILKADGQIAIIFPVFNYIPNSPDLENGFISKKILNKIKQIGFKVITSIPENLRKHPVIKLTSRNSIIYSRPKQKVLREIFVFQKNKDET